MYNKQLSRDASRRPRVAGLQVDGSIVEYIIMIKSIVGTAGFLGAECLKVKRFPAKPSLKPGCDTGPALAIPQGFQFAGKRPTLLHGVETSLVDGKYVLASGACTSQYSSTW